MATTERRRNGTGSIYKRKDGIWTTAISQDGKRKVFYGRRRQDVEEKLAAVRQNQENGLPISESRTTVEKHFTDWLVAVRPSLRPSTYRGYEGLVRTHIVPEIGSLRLTRLTPERVQKLYTAKLESGLAPATVVQLHAVLHKSLKTAASWGKVSRNVADLVSRPKIPRRPMKALSPGEASRLLEEARGDRLEAAYAVAVTGGLRQGEILGLRWRNVDLDGAAVEVVSALQKGPEGPVFVEPKTSRSRRRVSLTRTAVEALRRHRAAQNAERLALGEAWEDNDLVFPNEIGEPLSADRLRKAFWRLLSRAGLPHVRFHDLRHTAATLMLGQGVHPKVASEMLGHSTIAITLDLYSHVTPTMQRGAADAIDAALARGGTA
jgi:integrase